MSSDIVLKEIETLFTSLSIDEQAQILERLEDIHDCISYHESDPNLADAEIYFIPANCVDMQFPYGSELEDTAA